jgi:hypothetical protein
MFSGITSREEMQKVKPEGFRDQPFLPVIFLFLSLCYISVVMRIYTRTYLVKIFGWDDWSLLTALVDLL